MLRAVYTDINGITEGLFQSLLPHVSEERRLFALRAGSIHGRAERIMSEALARYVLSEAACADPERFEFSRTEFGKPYQTTVPGLFFNVSHSGGIVACVVSDTETGIDVERTGRIRRRFEDTILCDEEKNLIPVDREDSPCGPETGEKAVFSHSRDLFSTRIWCRKESYLKMLGTGIRIRPSDINTFELERSTEFGWLEGVLPDMAKKDTFPTFCYAICEKKVNLGIDKTDRITQCRKTLNFINPQDIVVRLEKT